MCNLMNNLFLHIWNKKRLGISKSYQFDKILGRSDIKLIVNNAIVAKNSVHILLVGSPGSAKTMFLLEIRRVFKQSLFVVLWRVNIAMIAVLINLEHTSSHFSQIEFIKVQKKDIQ